MQVRFLSEPANRQGLASVGSLNSTGSGALGPPGRGGYAAPATLDWSGRGSNLLNADSAALHNYFAKHAAQGNTVGVRDCLACHIASSPCRPSLWPPEGPASSPAMR